jgi:phosphohistidine phosphatase SixA
MCGVPAEDDDGNAATASAPNRITPVAGSFDALSKSEQLRARDTAADIVELWAKGNEVGAYELFYESDHSNEMKLGIWECLQPNSKVRNGIKKISEANKQKAA